MRNAWRAPQQKSEEENGLFHGALLPALPTGRHAGSAEALGRES